MCMVCIGPVGDPNRQDQPSLPQMPVGPFGGRDRDHAPELADRLLAMSVALGGHPSLAVDIALSPSAGPPSASGRRGQPHDAAACQERRRGAGCLHLQPARPGHQYALAGHESPSRLRPQRVATFRARRGSAGSGLGSGSRLGEVAGEVRARSECRRDPSSSTAAEPSPCNPARSSPNSAAPTPMRSRQT